MLTMLMTVVTVALRDGSDELLGERYWMTVGLGERYWMARMRYIEHPELPQLK